MQLGFRDSCLATVKIERISGNDGRNFRGRI